MVSLARRHIVGNAVKAKLGANIDNSTLAAALDAAPGAAGWPTGGANGHFTITIDPDTVKEERIDVTSRSTLNLTLAERGVDGTTAVPHDAGADVWITDSGFEADWANLHYSDTSHDHHTQYLNTARHAAISHTSAMIGADQINSSHIAANSVGNSEMSDNAIGTVEMVDANTTQAKLAKPSVGTPELIDVNVTTGKIANLAVTLGKMSAASVDDSKLVAERALWVVKATAPSPTAAHMLWLNTTKNCLLKRNAADTQWEVAFTFGPGVTYTPTKFGIAEGNGQNYARYQRFGRYVIVNGFFRLGAVGGSVAGQIGIGLPPNAPVADLDSEYANEFHFHGAARATDQSALTAFGGVGVIPAAPPVGGGNDRLDFIATAGGFAWNVTVPFTWVAADNDRFSWFCEYESSTAVDANFV